MANSNILRGGKLNANAGIEAWYNRYLGGYNMPYIRHENGVQPYGDDVLKRGIELA